MSEPGLFAADAADAIAEHADMLRGMAKHAFDRIIKCSDVAMISWADRIDEALDAMVAEQDRLKARLEDALTLAEERFQEIGSVYAATRAEAGGELERFRAALVEIADTFEIDWHEAQEIAREALKP